MMRVPAFRITAAICLGFASRAHGEPITVGNQLTLGRASGATLATERVFVMGTPSPSWLLRVDGGYARTTHSNRGTYQLAGMAIWMPSDHWSFDMSLALSPPEKAQTELPVRVTDLDGIERNATASVAARSWAFSSEIAAEYDAARTGPYSWTVGTALGSRLIHSVQRLDAVTLEDGPQLTAVTLEQACLQHECSEATAALLARDRTTLIQLNATLTSTFTIHDTKEFDASVAMYVYNETPASVGLFRLAAQGRSDVASTQALPVMPLRTSVTCGYSQRIRDWTISTFGQYGDYVGALGWNMQLGVKGKWRISAPWRLTFGIVAQRDATASMPIAWAGSLTVGGARSF